MICWFHGTEVETLKMLFRKMFQDVVRAVSLTWNYHFTTNSVVILLGEVKLLCSGPSLPRCFLVVGYTNEFDITVLQCAVFMGKKNTLVAIKRSASDLYVDFGVVSWQEHFLDSRPYLTVLVKAEYKCVHFSHLLINQPSSFLSDFPPPPPPPLDDDLPAPPPECHITPSASDAPPPAFPAPPPVADDLPLPAPPEDSACPPSCPSPPPPPPPPPLPPTGTSIASAAGNPQVSLCGI